MRRRYKKIYSKLGIAAGVPLAVGTLAYAGGKLPGVMGTTLTEAIAPSVPMAGAVSGIAFAGMGIDAMKTAFKIPKKLNGENKMAKKKKKR